MRVYKGIGGRERKRNTEIEEKEEEARTSRPLQKSSVKKNSDKVLIYLYIHLSNLFNT